MYISKASISYCLVFLSVVLFALFFVGTPSAQTIPAKPDAGQQPTGAPIFYNLTPPEGAIVAQDELSRAAATIETRREAKVSWAGIYVDGRSRPSDLIGATSYLQTISADVEDLRPGSHTVRVKAGDSKGRVGVYVWNFTVV